MAFKRSAVRSRLSPPKPEDLGLPVFLFAQQNFAIRTDGVNSSRNRFTLPMARYTVASEQGVSIAIWVALLPFANCARITRSISAVRTCRCRYWLRRCCNCAYGSRLSIPSPSGTHYKGFSGLCLSVCIFSVALIGTLQFQQKSCESINYFLKLALRKRIIIYNAVVCCRNSP